MGQCEQISELVRGFLGEEFNVSSSDDGNSFICRPTRSEGYLIEITKDGDSFEAFKHTIFGVDFNSEKRGTIPLALGSLKEKIESEKKK